MSITSIQSQTPTECQQMFLDLVTSTAKKLFKYMDIPLEKALTHRLYDLEVIDLSNEVSFIIICPPAEQACSVPGQREILLQRGDLLSLPIQAFEMIHLNTYQNSIINKYAKLSCTLELDTVLANHSHREAFSNTELQTAKDRLIKLQELQNSLNSVWKDCRWLMDVISFARDKDKLQGGTGSNNIGIQMKNLISRIPTTLISTDNNPAADNLMVSSNSNSNLKRTLLQIPPRDQKLAKSSPGRGSWPGPNAQSPLGTPGSNLLSTEFSKSEQHLSITPREDSGSTLNLSGSQYLSAHSDALGDLDPYSRKSSADSQFTHSSIASNNFYPSQQQIQSKTFEETTINNRLPPSRSQDTLLSQPNSSTQRRKSITQNASLSATSSPLLHAKPFYAGSMMSVHTVNTTNTSDSMHSISSDSEGQSFPISTSTPNKVKSKKPHKLRKPEVGGIASSRSMSNVKCSLDFGEPEQSNVFLKPTTYLKPTLNAIQSESQFSINPEAAEIVSKTLNEGKQFFRDKARTTISPEVRNVNPLGRCEGRAHDERVDNPQKDLKLSEKQAPLSPKTKVLQQQNNEASDVASSSDGSRYSSHGSLSQQATEQMTVKNTSPGILQVYAAYDTGLASGTSLKLHVTPRTSAREVVDLVVKQLNMAVVLKGKDGPIYTNDKLQNFCLVAVIGARERCLRDDFKPLQLQNPWRKGRLYVRQKHEVLAALEHSSKRAAFI